MIDDTAWGSSVRRNALVAIGAGGMIAGILDLTWACINEGWWDIPLVIAAGLLGREALHGGIATWTAGVLLHFLIALSFAAFYFAASRRLVFLKEHPWVCGLSYGVGVELVMNLVVLPVSALHSGGPFTLRYLLEGLASHMILVGLPISLSVRRFSN